MPEITSGGLHAQRLVKRSYYGHDCPGDYRSEQDRDSRQDPGGLRDQNVLHIPVHTGKDVCIRALSLDMVRSVPLYDDAGAYRRYVGRARGSVYWQDHGPIDGPLDVL